MRSALAFFLLAASAVAADPSMDRLVDLHNEARREAGGRDPLQADAKLMRYAQDWADTMAASGRMRHSSMANISALGFSGVAENIAWGQEDEREVMRAWLSSPGHRRNIMGRYTRLGCGAARRGGRLYWCVCFGRE